MDVKRDVEPDRSTREAAKAAWAYLAALGTAYDPESMLVDAPGIWEQHLDAYEEMLQTIGFEHLRTENERLHQMLKASEEHTQHHEAEAERLREAAGEMAATMRDVLTIVEAQPDYPWQGGALKQQIREDITALEALGLDLPAAIDESEAS